MPEEGEPRTYSITYTNALNAQTESLVILNSNSTTPRQAMSCSTLFVRNAALSGTNTLSSGTAITTSNLTDSAARRHNPTPAAPGGQPIPASNPGRRIGGRRPAVERQDPGSLPDPSHAASGSTP